MNRIIYQTPEGGVAVIVPAENVVAQIGIEAIALKDVPSGVPYKIIDVEDVPSDRTFRGAWEADTSSPDGFGAAYGNGTNVDVVGWNVDGLPILRNNQ